MPAKRKRGGAGARGRQKQEKDKPEGLDEFKDEEGEEGRETADDSFTDQSLQEENASELEMSVDQDKSQEVPCEEEAKDSRAEDGAKSDTSQEKEKKTVEMKEGKDGSKAEGDKGKDKKVDGEKTENTEAKNAEEKESKGTGSEKKAARIGLLETPQTRHPESIEPRKVKVVPLVPFEAQEMRSHWKWSIRLSGVRPEDILVSALMYMPKVQAAYYYLPQDHEGNGQMELCTKTTNDTILAMLRVLRAPFVNRTITVELTKRSFVRLDKKDKEGSSTMSETKPVQESADGGTGSETTADPTKAGKEEGEKEARIEEERRREEMMEEDEEEGYKGSIYDSSVAWGEAKETATFVINLNRIQRINIRPSRKQKGDIVRRSVYVGYLPKSTTEEMLKVVFPIANSIIMKPADDPKMRHAFLESSNHSNTVGFVTSYIGLKVNGQELELSNRAEDLSMLKSAQAEDKKAEKKDGENEEEDKKVEEEDKKVEEEDKKVEEKEEEAEPEDMPAEEDNEEKAEKLEDLEEGKEPERKDRGEPRGEPKGPWKGLTEEEKKLRTELNRQKKKRKREFLDEVHREWSAKRHRQDMDMPGPPMGRGPRSPLGPPMMGEGMFPFGDDGGMLGALAPPLFEIQDRVSSLLQLQNQLEQTISTQMEFVQQTEAIAREHEMRMRDLAMMREEMEFSFEESAGGWGKGNMPRGRGGFQRGGGPARGGREGPGGRFPGGGGRNFGSPGNKQGGRYRDFHQGEFNESADESQASGSGFSKRFRKESDSRYSSQSDFGGGKSFQGGNQGNTFQGQKKFGQGKKGFGSDNSSGFWGGGYSEGDAGNQFGDGSFSGGGKNKFGRGGKFGGGANQTGGAKFGSGNQAEGGNQMGAGNFGGNQKAGGKFSGGKKLGSGGNFGGSGNQTGNTGGAGNQTAGNTGGSRWEDFWRWHGSDRRRKLWSRGDEYRQQQQLWSNQWHLGNRIPELSSNQLQFWNTVWKLFYYHHWKLWKFHRGQQHGHRQHWLRRFWWIQHWGNWELRTAVLELWARPDGSTEPDGNGRTEPDGDDRTEPDCDDRTEPDGDDRTEPDGDDRTEPDGDDRTEPDGRKPVVTEIWAALASTQILQHLPGLGNTFCKQNRLVSLTSHFASVKNIVFCTLSVYD